MHVDKATVSEVEMENAGDPGSADAKFRSRRLAGWLVVPVFIYVVYASWWPTEATTPTEQEMVSGPTSAGDSGPLLDGPAMERLVRTDPIACLQNSLRLYHHNVQAYHATFLIRESEHGKLEEQDIVDAWYREKPLSIFMHWIEGPSQSQGVAYVQGGSDGKVQVRTAYARWVFPFDLDSSRTKSLKNFGLKRATERLLNEVNSGLADGEVRADYLGDQTLEALKNRPCHQVSVHFAVPREKGVTDIEAYLDKDSWLQIGTVLKSGTGDVVGDYFFTDLQINPEIRADQFEKTALKAW